MDRLNLVETHLGRAEFLTDVGKMATENTAMLERLRGALESGARITGADASFYFHEAAEATMMNKGIIYDVAHPAALAKYDVSPFSAFIIRM